MISTRRLFYHSESESALFIDNPTDYDFMELIEVLPGDKIYDQCLRIAQVEETSKKNNNLP